ncbi:Uma2 family endonuclease [Dorea formicigenerans]|uniref:Uma2 family endonuclease n=1 Tax=Dorea formicigenerans TaxID=39486 RepID=A0A412F6A5_9FIRM|nr:Uma2 family endonuclease [Dorea formicigenerans]RGR61174.1 Uma2 family endonuclease [Dorea formicigenerans]RGS64781.1 Uma2 family endonuclease [Dorea formicigenerans]RGT11266.1 Uma2 family endonuclease [Dorea formicigenerans]RHE29895.1 Uma2 family endonuclease [Dorea formicigenerans]
MPLPKEQHKYTVDDILALPDDQRAELIDGQIYDMGTPTKTHQDILGYLFFSVQSHIMNNKGSCQAMLAPFSIFLNNDDRNYVEPDLSVICNPSILDEKGCHGAPDWIIEIVSPSSERMDYVVKTFKYRTAGVREYWVIDKTLQKVTVFDFENDNMFEYDFTQKIPVLIYNGELQIDLSRFV